MTLAAPVATHAPYGAAAARLAADVIRDRLGVRAPALALILGSGLGGLARQIESARRVTFREIPGFPSAGVAGHAGVLIGGTIEGRELLALAGRLHLYEGHSARLAAFPARVLHALGAPTLFVSNAAGGLRRTFRAGDLMLIDDHINLTGQNPLIGAVEETDVRFPDMSAPYDRELLALLRDASLEARVATVEGVYAALLGPSYETPAEVRMLERLGADAVGMSTVPEVIVARAVGMRVAGMSCITNLASGITAAPLSHVEVIEVSERAAAKFERVVRAFVRRI